MQVNKGTHEQMKNLLSPPYSTSAFSLHSESSSVLHCVNCQINEGNQDLTKAIFLQLFL